MIEKLKEGIYRVRIPFENIYTSSFILIEGNAAIILDSGACDSDAEEYIIPTIESLGIAPQYLVSSHIHGDHHGGVNALKKAFPKATPALFCREIEGCHHLSDGEILLGRFKMLNLKGHCDDSLGVLDLKTDTLLSGDSLQMYGIDKYRGLISDRAEYLKSLDRVRGLGVKTIIASHKYEPLGSVVCGEKVAEFLNICEEAI